MRACHQKIARRIEVAASTARATIDRFRAAGLSWPLPDEMSDAALEAQLYIHVGTPPSRRARTLRAWEGKLSVTMRQTHAGDKLFE